MVIYSSANAEISNTYIGFDFTNMAVEFPKSITTPEWKHTERMARARIGLKLMPDVFPGLALESHLAMGASNETVSYTSDINGTPTTRDVNLQLETIIGLYVRSDFFNDSDTNVYGLLGLAGAQSSTRHIDVANSSDGINEPDSESGISYGLGFTYAYTKNFSMQLEYLSVVRKNSELGFNVSGLSVGFNFALDKKER